MRLAEAERNLRRTEQLRADKLVSESQLDQAQSEVAALEARLEALKSEVQVAEGTVRVRAQDLDDLLVRAPFDGVVVSKDAQPGEMVSPISAGGGFTRTGIATIVDMDSREIEVDVNESFINRVQANQKTEAVLDAYPDWIIPSHVINIVPTADRQKATVRVRIGVRRAGAAHPAGHGREGQLPGRPRRQSLWRPAPPCVCPRRGHQGWRDELRVARHRRRGRTRRGAHWR